MRFLPPAGHILYWNEIIRSFFRMIIGESSPPQNIISGENSHQHHYTDSGTSALYLLLKYLKSTSKKTDVIIPAYTCPSIVAAVRKVGLNPVLCDLNIFDFSLKLEDFSIKVCDNTLAVLQVELFGILPDNRKLIDQIKNNHIYFIGDTAQSLGNYVLDANLLKNRGYDYIVFSFGRGKPVNLLHGGGISALKMNTNINNFFEEHVPEIRIGIEFKTILNIIFYKLFFNPYMYNIPRSLPSLKLGETIYPEDFEVGSISPYVLELVYLVLMRYDDIYQCRRKHVKEFNDQLGPVKNQFYTTDTNQDYDMIRYPLLFRDSELRDKILYDLTKAGIGATGLYPFPINLQPELSHLNLGHCENANMISKSILTLPVHENVTDTDLTKIKEVFYKYSIVD